ncbi:YccF domain-containing protein [Nakamurella antarctica]|uniref:YccF domain-containing protein n=1 Tax=Nakamurella antarctica TaxID=1902245 RepID=A0A3G8ZMC4_9ACTN|nr:YccF domain-containing protein [Nakamurella antarctica]AZI57937.1 YccF domain-containing protein [Nakamurella antarctica]
MRLILNLIWLVFGGFFMFLGYLLAGVVMCVFVVTIPFGIAAFRIGFFALWPFGRTVVSRPGGATGGAASTIGNVMWFLLAGIWLAIGHLISGVLMCVTVIGIPLGLANFKLIPVSLAPLGKEIVSAH